MATAKKIEANRRNTRSAHADGSDVREEKSKSTGARTTEGRSTSSLNAYKHGLMGQLLVMTDNQAEEYERFTGSLIADLHPSGAMEEQLARSIADTHWRLNRAAAIENNIFASEAWNRANYAAQRAAERGAESTFDDIDHAFSLLRSFIDDPGRFQLLTTYEMRLQRKARSDLKQLRELQSARAAADHEAEDNDAADNKKPLPEPARPQTPVLEKSSAARAPQPSETIAATPPNGFVFSGAEFESRLARIVNAAGSVPPAPLTPAAP